jgi:hypothetical protein
MSIWQATNIFSLKSKYNNVSSLNLFIRRCVSMRVSVCVCMVYMSL